MEVLNCCWCNRYVEGIVIITWSNLQIKSGKPSTGFWDIFSLKRWTDRLTWHWRCRSCSQITNKRATKTPHFISASIPDGLNAALKDFQAKKKIQWETPSTGRGTLFWHENTHRIKTEWKPPRNNRCQLFQLKTSFSHTDGVVITTQNF